MAVKKAQMMPTFAFEIQALSERVDNHPRQAQA